MAYCKHCDKEGESVQKVKSPKQPNQNNKTLKMEEKINPS